MLIVHNDADICLQNELLHMNSRAPIYSISGVELSLQFYVNINKKPSNINATEHVFMLFN